MIRVIPNYKRIYNDMITRKHPEKQEQCRSILGKEDLSMLDVIKLNDIIFGIKDKQTVIFNQMHRSYDENTILEILSYQHKNNMNNTQLANHFSLSRNTVAKWKKHFVNRHSHSLKA
ncbi:hypothetical protein SAMN05421664_0753 [Chryseobacterium soldanellicola]|uniref:Helix-turn-helix domain-containing protein n=1 Tax=Chryseobacterium soldanellicola TaxID=311333 RepID=A0A1H0YJI6_9FLAO|nr:transposase [Chryseobacterium soldanellicola]SDQ15091.1 hypothetical protein SAMN05421664_0753 [Chryseobacterium soldanellicola]